MNGKLPLPGSLTNFKGINLLADDKQQETDKDHYRLYAYERNQWTTYAYVKVDNNSIDNLIDLIKDKEFINLIEDHHLSLVRGHFVVNHHHIRPVIESIKTNTSIYRQFNVCLTDLVVFKNENQSKCFLCLVETNNSDLNKVGFSRTIRDSLLQFDFKNNLNSTEQFSFHLSIAWCSADREPQLVELIEQLKNSRQAIEPILIKVNQFKVNIGNQVHTFNLKQ